MEEKSARTKPGAAEEFRRGLTDAGVHESYAEFLTEKRFREGDLGIYPNVEDCVKAALREVPDDKWTAGRRPETPASKDAARQSVERTVHYNI